MANTDYIEQVTNLERSMEKYVPKYLFDDICKTADELLECCSNPSTPMLRDENSVDSELTTYKERANKEAVELYTLDTQEGNKVTTTKRPINICPYCGDKMVLKWDDNDTGRTNYRSMYSNRIRPADYVVFACFMCGAKSPPVALSLNMLDESIIATEMGRVIDRAVWEKEHAGDEDEEYKED